MSERHTLQVISSYRLPYDYSPQGLPIEFEPLGPAAVAQSLVITLRRFQRRHSGITYRSSARPRDLGSLGSANRRVSRLANLVGPLEILTHTRQLSNTIDSFEPDLVHAMRIPYEAIAAVRSVRGRPFVSSIWGNDLTLHGEGSKMLGALTRGVLKRTDALHTDCYRDHRLASKWGWDDTKPSLVIPGSGGIDSRKFFPGSSPLRIQLGIPDDAPVVLNARGVRGYSYTSPFLDAIESLLKMRNEIHVVCTGMTRYAWIRERVKGMSFFDRVHLLPDMSHAEMPDVYRLADVTVSLTSHDGTPNSLLEALASGCLPVVSPLESVLEWVEHEVNGLVVDPTDTKAIVATLIRAVDDDQLRKSARHANITLVRERADLETCMERAIPFYQSILA